MNRWVRLAAAMVGMMMIANLQYSWSLFVKPLIGANHWKLSEVQWAFTFFIAAETWFMPCTGWMVDKIGVRWFVSVAGLFCGIGWATLGSVHSLSALYIFYTMAGLGAAMVYCGSVGIGIRWFPDKRGLAAGLITASFGGGAAFFVAMIAHVIQTAGYRTAFLYTGIGQGLIIILAAQFLKNPAPGMAPVPKPSAKVKTRTHEQFNTMEMLATPQFYVLYAMMLMMGVGGLMVTAQLAPLADSFKISRAALTLAVTMNPVANGISRISWGWVSDHLGRTNSMIIAFLLQAICLASVMSFGRSSDTAFVVSMALVIFTWGEIYSLFPSACADFFGAANVSSNYGFLYSSKGVASIIGGGIAALIFEKTGSWSAVFYGSAALALFSTLLAIGLTRMPLPRRRVQTTPMAAAAAAREA